MVGVGAPTDACRRGDSGDHPIGRSSSVGNRVQRHESGQAAALLRGRGAAQSVIVPTTAMSASSEVTTLIAIVAEAIFSSPFSSTAIV